MSTTRFPNGVTNVPSTVTLGAMGQLDPTVYEWAYSDFVEVESGFGASPTAIDGAGGLATLATTTAAVTPKKSFILNPAKELYMKAQFSLSATAGSTITLGIVDAIAAITKGVSLVLTTGTTLTLNVKGAGTSTVAATVAVPATTMTSIGLSYTPNFGFKVFVNDQVVASLYDASNMDNTTLCVAGLLSGGITTTLDYLFFAVER